jgi:hypothetical protein
MSKGNNLYKGNVQIYLQGQNALIPIDSTNREQITYFVGSEKSKLVVRDFRKDPVLAAHQALLGLDGVEFASIFNQPAQIEIKDNQDHVQIDLHESSENDVNSMLWLGVIKDNNIPIHYMLWEKFTNIDGATLAFAALIDD